MVTNIFMKKILLFVIAVLIVAAAGYALVWLSARMEEGRTDDQGRAKYDELVTLSVGDTATYPDGMMLSLQSIEDSRCPADAKCVRAGDIGVTLRFTGGMVDGTRTESLYIDSDLPEHRSATTVDGYTVRLDSVMKTPTDAKAALYVTLARDKDDGEEEPTEDRLMSNAAEKASLIFVSNVSAGDTVSSPLNLAGEAVGPWYFEASFPVELLDQSSAVIATGIATATSDWMTTAFVPFTASLTFPAQTPGSTGMLILHKDNPSGLPANDDALYIPVQF